MAFDLRVGEASLALPFEHRPLPRASTGGAAPRRDAAREEVELLLGTKFEGAALTILIVFLFLNSWRSTVITGLTLPVALIGTFLFMDVFGFLSNRA